MRVQFDTALNLAWILLGLIALATAIRVSLRAERREGGRRWLLVVGVGLIITALFPYISATDDVLRIDHYATHHGTAGHSQTDNLMRLYETMDTPLVCCISCIVLTFVFIAFVFTCKWVLIDRCTPLTTGRSPPAAFFAA